MSYSDLESGHRNGNGHGNGIFANGHGYRDGSGYGNIEDYDGTIGHGEEDADASMLNHGYGFGNPEGSGLESTKNKCCGHGDYNEYECTRSIE
jgi:hypothetical protein